MRQDASFNTAGRTSAVVLATLVVLAATAPRNWAQSPAGAAAQSGSIAAAACRVSNYRAGGADRGSGTLVDVTADRGRGLVLTCAHLFADGAGRIVVEFADGSSHGGLLIAIDRTADLAAVEIANPRVAAATVAAPGDLGGMLRACGFGPVGAFRCVTGQSLGVGQAAGRMDLRLAGAVRSGDSGGGVFDARGQLVGVVWGECGGVTYASAGAPLARFLQQTLGAKRGAAAERPAVGGAVCVDGRCPLAGPGRAPAVPAGRSPAAGEGRPAEAPRGCPCGGELAAIRARLDALQRGDGATGTPASAGDSSPASEGGSSFTAAARSAAAMAAAALGLGAPAGAAVIVGATLAGWLWRRRRQARGARRGTRVEESVGADDSPLAPRAPRLAPRPEATAAAAATFPAEGDAGVRVETRAPIERDDREARQLLRPSQLEGRDPLQDAVAGRLALDRLDAIAEGDADENRAAWAAQLSRELRERFNEIAPTKFEVRCE